MSSIANEDLLLNIQPMKMAKIRIIATMCFLACAISGLEAQSTIIPTTAISNIPTVSIKDMDLNRNDYSILKSVSATAVVNSDNRRSRRTIYEENDEFKLIYDIIKIDGKRYLDYESCEGVVRLGYIGSTDIYNSESNYLPAEEIVRRLALYRLINLAKEYGADALFEPTITTTATSTGKKLTYKTEASAKLIKIIND